MVGKAVSHGFDPLEQLKVAGTQIELRQLPAGFPGNVYEATSFCCTFLVLIGSYGGEGSALRSPLFEIGDGSRSASRRGVGPSVAAAPYPHRLRPGIPGKCSPYQESYPQPPP